MDNKTCIPCQGGIPPLNKAEISNYITDYNLDWDVFRQKELRKEFIFETYKSAINFANRVAELAEIEGHHPYIHINYKKVIIKLFTHKINGLHENDFIIAYKCDKMYR